jgi:hypothetical protein
MEDNSEFSLRSAHEISLPKKENGSGGKIGV